MGRVCGLTIMGKSVGTVWHYFHKGIEELANILE